MTLRQITNLSDILGLTGRHDPYELAEAVGIRVEHAGIRSATGMWLPDENLIVIRAGMRRVWDECTMAHELAHAVLGHRYSTPQNERDADRLTASRLVCPDTYARATAMYQDVYSVAEECDVTPKLLRAFDVSRGQDWLPPGAPSPSPGAAKCSRKMAA